MRVKSLTQECRALAAILYLITRLEKRCPGSEKKLRHHMSYHIPCSLLVDPGTPGGMLRQKLATFPSTLKLHSQTYDEEVGLDRWTERSWREAYSATPVDPPFDGGAAS